jgi:hypothetical protein
VTKLLTLEELTGVLDHVQAEMLPAITRGMKDATLNVEGKAKQNCTPGKSPYESMNFPTKIEKAAILGNGYTGAPYSYDNDPDREPPHLRDVMFSKVEVDGNRVVGIVGNPKSYAAAVHDGTSTMFPRPFIYDAIVEKEPETRAILSEAIERAILQNSDGDLFGGGSSTMTGMTPTAMDMEEDDDSVI